MNARHVVVIGGGIIGCALGWRLAQRGARVTIIEKEQPGTKASWAAAGMLAPLLDENSPLRPLAAASLAEYPAFAEEVHRASGIDPGIIIDRERGGSVDNRRLVAGLVQAGQRAGVRFLNGVGARAVVCGPAGFESVQLSDGRTIAGDAVVVAAGAWSGQLLGLPLRLPVVPVRGQMLAVEHVPPHLPHIVEGEDCYLVPRGERLLIGATVERVGFDESTTEAGIAGLLSAARRMAPQLAHARVLDTWAGLRPGTPDDLPILGADPHCANLFYATGHFRNGILLTPVTARLLADLILEGVNSRALRGFEVGRLVVAVEDPRCDLCGTSMKEWHCRIICPACGYQRDCSDP